VKIEKSFKNGKIENKKFNFQSVFQFQFTEKYMPGDCAACASFPKNFKSVWGKTSSGRRSVNQLLGSCTLLLVA
jgi:hypothetical protein